MPNQHASITDAQLSVAKQLISGGLSIRRAAEKAGISESGLRYRLNANRHASGAAADKQEEKERDELSGEPSDSYEVLPVIERDYRYAAGNSPLPHRIYPLGDVHLGSPAHAADRWKEWIEYLQVRPNTSVIITGDLFNCALKDSKSESYDEILTVGEAIKRMRKQLAPLARNGQIDLMLQGNHEARVYRAAGIDPIEVIADALEVPYVRHAALIRYQIGDNSGGIEYTAFVRHGTGNSAGNLGSRATALERSSKIVDADIYVSSHTHSQLIARDRKLVHENGKVLSKRRLYVSSGSFLNWEDYARERAYVPGDIGAPRIRLDGVKHDAHASI